MIRIVTVEDEESAANILKKHAERYNSENGKKLSITEYRDSLSFLANYKSDADLIFMDIKMPGMDGLTCAHRLRKTDSSVILVFVTDMVQYAIDGYSVEAMDFIVKPITYDAFRRVVDKAANILSKRNNDEIVLKHNGVVRRVRISGIYYIEVQRHRIIYHTEEGEVEGWGSLESIMKSLPAGNFSRCHISFLVNLHHVQMVQDDDVIVAKTRLHISRRAKKSFLADLAKYLGGAVDV